MKYIYCPQYKPLSIEKVLEEASKNPCFKLYMPEDRDMHKVPRQWIINVAYSVMGETFNTWVKEEIVHRNEEVARKQKLLIEMDNDIAKAFHSSVNISSKLFLIMHSIWLCCLIICLLFSNKWKFSTSSQTRIQTSPNLSRDVRITRY